MIKSIPPPRKKMDKNQQKKNENKSKQVNKHKKTDNMQENIQDYLIEMNKQQDHNVYTYVTG